MPFQIARDDSIPDFVADGMREREWDVQKAESCKHSRRVTTRIPSLVPVLCCPTPRRSAHNKGRTEAEHWSTTRGSAKGLFVSWECPLSFWPSFNRHSALQREHPHTQPFASGSRLGGVTPWSTGFSMAKASYVCRFNHMVVVAISPRLT